MPEHSGVIADAATIARIRAGDERAFELLFRSSAPALVRFATKFGISYAVAEELVADLFFFVWESRGKLPERGNLAPYLYRAVRNRALNVLRGEQREQVRHAMEQPDDINSGYSVDPELSSTADIVWAAAKSLPETQRTALYLRYTLELSLAEVAETMEVTIPAVKNLLQRAHSSLKARLEGKL